MVCSAIAVPLPIREREAAVERTADVAHLRRREESIGLDVVLAEPQRLVFELPVELAEGRVEDALGQLGSRKALQRQVLDTYRIVPADDRGTELVLEVPTPVGKLPVDDGGLDDRLGSALRAALATGHGPLGTTEPTLSLAEELGGGDRLGR